jgi:hypothetical protein
MFFPLFSPVENVRFRLLNQVEEGRGRDERFGRELRKV